MALGASEARCPAWGSRLLLRSGYVLEGLWLILWGPGQDVDCSPGVVIASVLENDVRQARRRVRCFASLSFDGPSQ